MSAPSPVLLVVAKAPVPGHAKTRLATNIGYEASARLAAAALLDTLDVAGSLDWPVVVAMTGELADAARGAEIADVCRSLRVVPQRGRDLGARLAAAHADAAGGDGVVQVGMDTPQLRRGHLVAAGLALESDDAALGLAEDGGWWVLAVREPTTANCLADVPMSLPDTGALTLAALESTGHSVAELARLRDVDTWDDARVVAADAPHTRFAREFSRVAEQVTR